MRGIATYARGIEDIAREKAKPEFDRAMEAVRSVGQQIYVDPDGAAAKIGQAIVNAGADGQTLANAATEHPERFGELRGKTGFFGDSKERKAAHHSSKALGLHVASAANTWSRRLEAERQSETWQR